jgi:hypothetical protein
MREQLKLVAAKEAAEKVGSGILSSPLSATSSPFSFGTPRMSGGAGPAGTLAQPAPYNAFQTLNAPVAPFNSAPSPFGAPPPVPSPFARPPQYHGFAGGFGAQQPRRSSVQMNDAPPLPDERYLQQRRSKRELAHRRLDEMLDELEQ